MGKTRKTNNTTQRTQQEQSGDVVNQVRNHATEWITHIVDFIDENMTDDEITYINNHMDDIQSFAPNGLYRSENSNRTFNPRNLKEGDTFSFDNGEFKAFSKEEDTVERFSSDTLALGGPSTIFHLTKGKGFDVSKLGINDVMDEQETWISSNQQFRVDNISTTTLNDLNYNSGKALPKNLWDKIKDKEINIVEISEV